MMCAGTGPFRPYRAGAIASAAPKQHFDIPVRHLTIPKLGNKCHRRRIAHLPFRTQEPEDLAYRRLSGSLTSGLRPLYPLREGAGRILSQSRSEAPTLFPEILY